MSIKKIVGLVFLAVLIIVGALTSSQIFESVEKGTYHIKQAAVTGTMYAIMEPGMYMQMFGDVERWPVAETFFFTADTDEGERRDQSIEVRFNDGALAKISGTLRVDLPRSEAEAIDLVVKHGYRSYSDVEHKLVLPTVRNALRLTANLMTARESFAEKRPSFIEWARDQVENGLYQTEEKEEETLDILTGEKIKRVVKVIKTDEDGNPIRQPSPLGVLGMRLSNFEVKVFQYERRVLAQIQKQQEATMAAITARSKVEQARKEAEQAEAEGKKAVMQAKYSEEEQKIKAVVQAERDKETTLIQADKVKQEQKLLAEAAKFERQKMEEKARGERALRQAKIAGDGALDKKLEAWIKVNEFYANAWKERPVPTIDMSGSGGGKANGGDVSDLVKLMTVKHAKDIALDNSIK